MAERGDLMADRTKQTASRDDWLATLDPGIAPYVDVLDAAGIETFESCQAGEGHCFPEPTVRFHGVRGEGFRALAVALQHGFPVASVRRYWDVNEDGEPEGPRWEMTFWRAASPLSGGRVFGHREHES